MLASLIHKLTHENDFQVNDIVELIKKWASDCTFFSGLLPLILTLKFAIWTYSGEELADFLMDNQEIPSIESHKSAIKLCNSLIEQKFLVDLDEEEKYFSVKSKYKIEGVSLLDQ